MKNKVPDKCKTCRSFYTGGIPDGKYNKWCCNFGSPVWKTAKHCNLIGGYVKK